MKHLFIGGLISAAIIAAFHSFAVATVFLLLAYAVYQADWESGNDASCETAECGEGTWQHLSDGRGYSDGDGEASDS